MKATYNDFLENNKNCSKFASNKDAIEVFNFLNQDDNIIKMIDYCDAKKPALLACVLDLEAFVAQLSHPTIDLTDSFTRTVIGRMIKSILKPFGYWPKAQKPFPPNYTDEKGRKVQYFASAHTYALTKREEATMKITKCVTEIKETQL